MRRRSIRDWTWFVRVVSGEAMSGVWTRVEGGSDMMSIFVCECFCMFKLVVLVSECKCVR